MIRQGGTLMDTTPAIFPPTRFRSREERRAFWAHHVELWGVSGLSQQAYCRREGLSPACFGRWKRCLTPADIKSGQTGSLVAVSPPIVSAAFSRRSALDLVVDERYRLEISESFSPSALESVLRVLARL